MKYFLIGFITALIIGAWITLAITGIITIKIAIIVPVCIIAGFIMGFLIIGSLFTLEW